MFSRFSLATLTAALLLSGCARHAATDNSASADAPAPATAAAPIENQDSASPFASGPTVINVSHLVTRTDDGSSVYLTVDGQDAGMLQKGENRLIHVPAGKHQVGGYVQTLFGFGKVTIQAVDITTDANTPKNVVYSVTRQKPQFSETAAAPNNS
ncbi:hypothetical protein HA48_14020 [Pantoea wallisii]|uniref:DUF2846 domain-containing protein n=1 Tax=Pantoea wallisii TaxID=1076551 RepID=A0A1X1D723_9GAMM|nr:hypothetical protein [Pantoea wallisii]ORM72473.1 hypothetical protein HA48_14020 [Pantoea wallisii]